VDLSMRELCLSLGTSPSLGGGVSMPISPVVVVVVVVVVVSVSTATVIRIIVSGRTMMVSLAVVLVLLVVSLVIAAVLAARHDEKTFLFQRGEMFLCDDHKEKARKKRI
jgi:hypothetical protein